MNKYVEGYTNDAEYCPMCSGDVVSFSADGSNSCGDCGYKFYVITKEENEDE